MEEYKARIQRLGQLKGGRVIAISDIHGHAQWLKRLLEELRLTDQDELFIVGDLIERGPENLETLRLIMELQRRGAHVSRGNWDLHVLKLLDGAKDQADNGLMSAARAFTQRFGNSLLGDFLQGAGMDLGMEGEENRVLRAIQAAYAPEIEFLRGLPDIMETPHMIFVHGGIPHERLDVLEDQSAGVFLKNDCFVMKGLSFRKFLVVGHTPARSYTEGVICHAPYIHWEQRIASIDGGCGVAREGQINALILPQEDSEEFSWISQDDFPFIRALEDQKSSENPLTIHWPHNEVEILSRERDGVLLRHCFSGRVFSASEGDLFFGNGGLYIRDMTDYQPAVRAGETLKLISAQKDRAMVKKNGLVGWYSGRYEKI